MENLLTTVINKKNNRYVEGIHYKYFICEKMYKVQNPTDTKKELFLTYKGILRVLFCSHSKKADSFVDWATETLFTAQMGTRRARKNLAASILGVDAEVIREVFDK